MRFPVESFSKRMFSLGKVNSCMSLIKDDTCLVGYVEIEFLKHSKTRFAIHLSKIIEKLQVRHCVLRELLNSRTVGRLVKTLKMKCRNFKMRKSELNTESN